MMTSAEIRMEFLNFFAKKNHLIVPSAPIVVKNDPTLLFTNAGMNQFKDYFLGNKKPENARVADTQKCLRVSGKHNDLEEVGVDTYHHTMFEMLGNWSFGDYFKTEAIAWSWELLTEVYKLDKDRLYVTVFEGNVTENLPKDVDAFNEWKKVIGEDRILMGNKKDNFWEMGDTGPCGPCTEIHYDSRSNDERKQIDGKTLVNADHPQVIEIWNNVFIQFNRLKNGQLEALPARHVDTGMGLERLVRVIQQKNSNYDTDLFTGTIAEVENLTGKKYTNTDDKKDIAFRVIADHIRAIAFTIADGQLPSNTGAGYVIRRILRRAVRYYYSYLDYSHPLLFKIITALAIQFEHIFPELIAQKDFILKVVREEEEGFLRTLDKGITRFNNYTAENSIEAGKRTDINDNKRDKIVFGEFAFELNDTYGFPIDLTELMAKEQGWSVDIQGYQKALEVQKLRSRSATAMDTGDWVVLHETLSSEFVGYNQLEAKSMVTKYRKVTGKGKEAYQLVLNTTPFYAESGGQVGDKGQLTFGDETIEVFDTKKENNLTIHFTNQLPFQIDQEVVARVHYSTRKKTEIHHSATHLLHAALRQVLGIHVAQKGSLVNYEHLRFDFSHFVKVTDEEVAAIETIVNEKIRENVPVVISQMSRDEAVGMGAMALFGEKYGDVVRVVTMDPTYSIELCGGTHVGHTGQIGFFKIKHETAVAAGVRRIEAVSGPAAEEYVNNHFNALAEIRGIFKNPKDVFKTVENLQFENAELKKKLESFEAKLLTTLKASLSNKVEDVNGIQFIGQIVEVNSSDSVKKLCIELKSGLENHVVVLASKVEGKAQIALMIEEKIVATRNLDATKIVKEQIAPLIKGGGGGHKTLATAGGQEAGNMELVIKKVKDLLMS